ncbi:MAG: hypothetical protein QXK77_00565, partial [Archaeoglobaceae archaeon]
EKKLTDAMDLEKIVEGRKNLGGTASEEVRRMLGKRKEKLRSRERVIRRLKKKITIRLKLIEKEVEKLGGIFSVGGEKS